MVRTERRGRGGSRVTGSVMIGILAVAGLGFGVVAFVGALEPEGCGAYGYGGYGCEVIGDASIVVTPSTDLVDRQEVTLTGEGFGPSTSFGVAQCDPSVGPGGGTDACDLSNVRTTTTDPSGGVELTMLVRRIITVQGREVDCALEPCTLGAATLNGSTPIEATSTPISFNPDVPPIPRLTVELTVDDASASAMTGTITCNRDAEAYVDTTVSQTKGSRTAFAYGSSDAPLACSTAPTAWTIVLANGSGRFTGGKAHYEVSGQAYDGFDSASSFATGDITITGGQHRTLPPGEDPGETVSIEIVGTSQVDDGIVADVRVTCDRAVPEGTVYVRVSQWAGLDQVEGFGQLDLGPCEGVRELAVPITYVSGKLVGGPADVEAFVEVYDFGSSEGFYDFASARTSVRLSGAQRATPVVVEPNPSSRITIAGTSRDAVTGTVECDEPAEVDLSVAVQQRQGRTVREAYGYDLLSCDGTTPFSVDLDGGLGGGEASAFVYASAYEETEDGYEFLWDDQQAASLHIGG